MTALLQKTVKAPLQPDRPSTSSVPFELDDPKDLPYYNNFMDGNYKIIQPKRITYRIKMF